ncbi:MAG: four helix bundle protein [Candidatus Magasanikbacteria bacterium]|nr:four helix bundle protein [Candidatus Magasanikbacteria bacterium]
MKDFRSLNVWEKGHKITVAIYKQTQSFPKEEIYGLTSQIRRASTSIPTNIAEGCGRGSDADFARFLQMSFGSANETEYLLLLCFELGFIAEEKYFELNLSIQEIKKMLSKLIITIRK